MKTKFERRLMDYTHRNRGLARLLFVCRWCGVEEEA